MNNKVEVSALILTIGDQEIKLTLAQARELLSALRKALALCAEACQAAIAH